LFLQKCKKEKYFFHFQKSAKKKSNNFSFLKKCRKEK
jgi:hypothetical protein